VDLDKQQDANNLTPLAQERDVFKRQFLRIQENYENKIKELSILKELGNTLRSTNFYDKEAFFGDQLEIIKRYTTLEGISLLLFDEELQILEEVARSSADGPPEGPTFLRVDNGPYGQALVEQKPVLVDSIQDSPERKGLDTNRDGSLLCVPVMHNNKSIGILCLHHTKIQGFDQNQIRFYSLVADQIATSVILFRIYHQMLREEKNRLLLSRFFSNTVTEKIFGSGENLRLGGERKNVTILFADLRGFTSMSEDLDQEKVVEILNAYFSLMTPIIFEQDGTLDKLMGDGIMAFFGAPLSHNDDPLRAVRTAMKMVNALEAFNKQTHGKRWPTLEVSIGVNTGEVVAGYIGSEEHLNYTVIGDAVNLAQRLQTIAGPNEILISKTVRNEIHNRLSDEKAFKALVSLPAQKVKGKEKAVEVFRVEL
jgi:adenylate cyclase